jgi:hypothetical protein
MHLNEIEDEATRLGRPLNSEQVRSAVTYLKWKEPPNESAEGCGCT